MKRCYKKLSIAVMAALLAPALSSFAATVDEEEALDRKLGLLDESFEINLASLRTRSDLRDAAKIRTGLPSYDQDVEMAQKSPASLFAELTAPEPTPEPVKPKKKEKVEPKCYIDEQQQKICE